MPLLLQAGNRKSPNGFSLIELVAVLVLLAILGVAALGRLGGMDGYQSLGFFNETVNGLRYAQKLAMATGCRVQARITGSGWQLYQGDSCNSDNYSLPVSDPAKRDQPYARSVPAGLAIVAFSQKALKATETATCPRAFLDLQDMMNANKDGYTPYTPSTPMKNSMLKAGIHGRLITN